MNNVRREDFRNSFWKKIMNPLVTNMSYMMYCNKYCLLCVSALLC